MQKIALFMENSREYGREILKGVAQFAQERRDWQLRLLGPSDLMRTGALDSFDGVIARIAGPSTRRRLREAGIPVVDAFCQIPDPDFLGVDSDHVGIAQIAADFFLARGFQNFACCGYTGTTFSDMRCGEFSRRIEDAGYACHKFVDPEPPNNAIFFAEKTDLPRNSDRLKAWVRELPPRTAVFCANDLRAYHLARICFELRIRIPQEIAVLGVDNDPLLCHFATLPISSIDPHAKDLGYAAARLLNTAMEGQAIPSPHSVLRVKPGGLVERASTEFHPVDSPWLSEALVYIDRNLSRTIATADIVALSGLSHTTVERTFHAVFGETVGHYILRAKMTEARRLLEHSNLSCKEIAVRTGFTSPQYFCRSYRAFFGHSPLKGPIRQ